uniref:Uncharacterized protein n=1 Tax=Hucho hucho TaxID=62062 RepID=A0A4W5LAR7_9TELE
MHWESTGWVYTYRELIHKHAYIHTERDCIWVYLSIELSLCFHIFRVVCLCLYQMECEKLFDVVGGLVLQNHDPVENTEVQGKARGKPRKGNDLRLLPCKSLHLMFACFEAPHSDAWHH